jgi:phosphoribosylformylglycinamidine synthase
LPDPASGVYGEHEEDIHMLMKVETHNHPTAIAPHPARRPARAVRSATRARPGGRQAQGGALRVFGLQSAHPRRRAALGDDHGKPGRIVSALDIMLDGPIGAAAFNNEFGRPNLAGYFRTYEQGSPARR